MDDVVEKLGFGLIVAFLWFVWPPLVLLGAGVLLIVWANVRASRRVGAPSRLRAGLAAALGSFRQAYRQQSETVELRRVA